MKKIIKLSLFFAAVAAGNFAQAVVIAGQPQQASTSPYGVHDMVAMAPVSASKTSSSAKSSIHHDGFFGEIGHSIEHAVSSIKSSVDKAGQSIGEHVKPMMISKVVQSVVESAQKHFSPKEVHEFVKQTVSSLTDFLHAGVKAHASASSSSSTPVMTMVAPTSASTASSSAPVAPTSTVKVQGLASDATKMGASASTYAPIQFTNSSGQKGNYWENTSSQTGLGRAQINGKNYEAVVEFNAPSSAHRGSIGPAYTWAYNTDQQAAIKNMKLDIKNARTIGTLHIQTHTQSEIDAAKTKLMQNNMSMVVDAAKIEENKKLEAIINGRTKSLLGIEVTNSSSSATTASSSSHMMTMTKPTPTVVSATSDAVPAIPTMPGIVLPKKK